MTNSANSLKIWLVLAVVGLTLACNLPRPWTAQTPGPDGATVTTNGAEATGTAMALPSLEAVAAPQILSFVMLNRQDGWALGEGALLRTEDGGVTWLNATPPGLEAGFGSSASLAALDAGHAWLLVPLAYPVSGMLYHTADGGRTWAVVPVPFSGGDLKFLDARRGWIMADRGAAAGSQAIAIFRTEDGGATWKQIYVNDPTLSGASDTLPLSGIKSGLGVLDEQHAWVGGSLPMDGVVYLYTSNDGGYTWAPQTVTLPAGYESAQTMVSPPRFFDLQQGVFAVILYAEETAIVFYRSRDGGQTWTATSPLPTSGLSAIASPEDLWVWDGGPQIHFSKDGGLTWETRATNLDLRAALTAFQFLDADYGWALTTDESGHRAFYHTTDGGAHWMPLIP